MEELKEYFETIIPDYSKERVYLSDIKKVIQWYNILYKKNLLIKEEPETASESEEMPVAEKEKEKATEKKTEKKTKASPKPEKTS